MEQGIKFVITGDTSGLEEATKKADSALSKLNSKISQIEKDIADNIHITQGYEKAVEELSREFKSGIINQDKYAKSLQRLQRGEKETIVETDRLRKELAKLKRDQKSLASVGGNTFKEVKKGAANAVPTLQEFSRVIQDAPYGIQGVGNNITQLVSQFGYLKKSAGGGKQALKALAASFAGPGGILFAISTAVSLLTVYGDELFKSTKVTNKLTNATKEVNDSLSDFYGKTVSKINTYVSILEDANTSEEKRLSITKKLIKEVPNLTQADFEYGNSLDKVREKIAQYTLAQASRIEADTLVSENSKLLAKKAILESKLTDDIVKKVKQGSFEISEVNKKQADSLRKYLKELGVITTEFRSDVLVEVSDLNLVEIAKKELEKTEKELAPLTERLNELYSNSFDVDKDSAELVKNTIPYFEDLIKKNKDLLNTLKTNNKEDLAKAKLIRTQNKEYERQISLIRGVKGGDKGKKQVATRFGLSFTPTVVSDPKKIAAATRSYLKKGQEIVQNPSFGSLKLPVSLGLDKNNLDSFKQLEKINFPKLDEFIKGGDKQALSFPSLKELKAGFSEYKNILSDISDEDLAIINPFSDLKLEMPVIENEAFTSSLEEAFNRTKIFTDALGSSFNALGGVISNALATGNAIVDAFVSSITNSLSSLLAEFVANQIAMAVLGKTQIAGEQAKANASGIVVATQGATAFGPLAPLALPGLLASTAAVINGSFAPLYAFSQGGIVPGGSFTGDKVPILANGGERILTTQDQSLLNHVLRGGYASTTNKGGGQIVEVVGQIRNETIYLANKRAGKQNRRIN